LADLISTGKTFRALLLDMAVELGIARMTGTDGTDNQTLELPDDGSVLFKLRQRCNAGYLAFVHGEHPLRPQNRAPYTRWTFLDRQVSVTLNSDGLGALNIAADSARYRLPDGITGNPRDPWTIDTNGLYPGNMVENVSESRVTSILAVATVGSGCPIYATTRPIQSPDSPDAGKAWELLVAPRPSGAMTMTSRFRVQARELQDLNQQHIAGAEHDRAVFCMAMLEWYRRDAVKPEMYGRWLQTAASAVDASIELDKRSRPMVVGGVQDPSVGRRSVNRGDVAAGQVTTVTYSQGIPLSP
jgi:hypothetical protein